VYHFGESCVPGVIINNILSCQEKKLFMLGHYNINDIIQYLIADSLEEIYDKQYFVFNSTVDKGYIRIQHSKYNFIFNHDYLVANGSITNYDKCAERFKLKINNFRTMMNNTKSVLLINFSEAPDIINIKAIEQYFKKHNKKFILLIFTNAETKPIISNSVYIVKIDRDLMFYWTLKADERRLLNQEIYEKFISTLKANNIIHSFPSINQVFPEAAPAATALTKCARPTCNYEIHINPANNGGNHCCRACKLKGTHGPACAHIKHT